MAHNNPNLEHPMKYVAVQYHPGGRLYTYECDDPTVQPQDEVQITLPSGVSMTLPVIEVSGNKPPFPCKSAMKVS